ncbi:MAG TPA: hypothetical protein VMZ91_05350 [Candidatus Paceibacterota bacterium]|nr:hypothetical protein [Candidatus Paceibacterota bacterium]
MVNMTKKEKGNYVIPSPMAKVMAKVSPRTQYEAAMMSIIFIICGLLIMAIYYPFTNASLFMRIFLPINSICGIILLSSYLVTTFQQYQSYLMAMGIMEDMVNE